MKQAIVVGSGAGGATVAKELQEQGKYQVTILEAGKAFRPLSLNLTMVERIKKTRLFFDERLIQLLFPAMKIRKTKEPMVLVNGIGTGGTTTLATGSAIRVDRSLKKLGINLDIEFQHLYREIPISIEHKKRWHPMTRYLFEVCRELDLNPQPLPKMGDSSRCSNCGRCILGCPQGAKWDSRQFLNLALKKGARLVTGCKVKKVMIRNNQALGVYASNGWFKKFYPADLIVLSAGGFATPVILENSGIPCEKKLSVDPVLCVATEWPECRQSKEISMPFVIEQDHFIISPYFDYLSFFFNRQWRFQLRDTLSLMIKLADSNEGHISEQRINKFLTGRDKAILKQGVEICEMIFSRLGVKKEKLFLGTLNAGHPGGMIPLTRQEAQTLHPARLPANLYVADASLFPESLGFPPILTIMAMAKRVSKVCQEQ
jgi:choline dehydrogenase-like flavoprotein